MALDVFHHHDGVVHQDPDREDQREEGDPVQRVSVQVEDQEGERSVGEVVEATGANQANVSRHLSTLVQAGILARRKAGTRVYYRIADESVFELCRVVCGRLQAEEQALRAEPPRDWSI
ncbi:MAG: ArsR/SmtB family transcription factor [Opitutales bacterium]